MYIFIKAAKRVLLLSLIIALTTIYSIAQNNSAESTSTVVTKQKNGEFKVTGTVKEASTGKALPGINISVPGYSAALTDDKGFFSITVTDKSASLMVSGPGFQRREVPLKGRSSIDVSLFEDSYNSVYDEAHMPYGNVPLNQIAHSVTSFNTTGNWERATETPDSWLQGRVVGLNAVRRSGTPSIGADLFLRGFNSLYATNQPLYVVDGVIYDVNSYGNSLITGHATNPMADIDIKDIDNVTVIKDGASMYGTRGGNGVILITTSVAKEVATKIDFAVYGGFNSTPKLIPVMKAGDYRTYLSDLLKTTGLNDDLIQSLPFMNDNTSNPDYYRYHNETNWQNEVMKNSFNQNYHLRVTGGDDIAKYALSLGYTTNKGIITNTGLTRYFMRFNANLKLSSRLTANANLAFTSSQQDLKDQGINIKTNPLYLGLVKAPFLPIYQMGDDGAQSPNLADTDIFGISNPSAAIQKIQDLNKNYRFSGSFSLRYELSRNFNINTIIGLTFDKVRENIFVPNNGIAHDTVSLAIASNRSGSNVQRLFSLYNDTRISYNQTFDNIHNISANIGARYNSSSSQSDYGLGYNSATDNFVSVGNGSISLRKVGGEIGDWNWLNTYFNTDYKLLSRYFLSFNVAFDGSSRFGKKIHDGMALTCEDNKFAILPSIAAGWLVSSEKFMSKFNFVDMLKLRTSYGLTGNDDIGNYTSRQYYVSQNLLGMEGLVRGNIGNPQLKWENVAKFDLGMDASLYNERLSFSFDVFKNKTTDMITFEPINTASGFPYAITNNSGMKTSGVELAVNGRILNRTIKWDIGLNLSTSKNQITKIPNDKLITTTFGGASILTEVGKAANLFYGYKTSGVYATQTEISGQFNRTASGNLVPFQAGDVRFVDKNGDKIIDEKDMQVIGNPNPDFVGSFSNVISWKRWSFDALITFSKGNDIYNYTRAKLESMSGGENQMPRVINRWRAEGQVTNVPRAAWGDPSGNSRFSDRWIEDGSYIRLRTLSLTFDFPVKEGYLIKYAKIYATGNNLLTLTKYLGYDPEFSATGSVFSQGVDIGFEPQFRSIQLGVRIGL
ncbi:MAG: SusC/RagA family TonB-linked outer membrane protein [Bacteroidia bacterium]|nr:SusC/RagA family TonB-linked outer membrane protein [Bacteroidia bacterium]